MLRTRWALALCLFGTPLLQGQKLPFDVQGLLKLSRIGDPQLSPDGKLVAFTVQSIDLDKNTRPRQIWIAPLDGGPAHPITTEGTGNHQPRWSRDARQIAFLSDRGGSTQVWTMNPDGTGAKQITNLSTEAGGFIYSPDGKQFLVTSAVYPDCADDACNKKKLEAETASMTKARIYTSLLYRHWTTFQGTRRTHLLAVPAGGGPARDLTPGARDVPPFSLGGPDDYAISPDSTEVCYVANPDPQPALSTNSELYVVPLAGGESKKITLNPAADVSPSYSPDGKFLAYRMQARAGYESDRWRLAVLDRATGKTTVLTEALDRGVTAFSWTPDSRRLVFAIEDRGRQTVQMIPVTGGGVRALINGDSHVDDMQFTPDGKTMIFTENSGAKPVEIYKVSSSGGAPVPLTRINEPVLSRYQFTPLEEFTVDSADGSKVSSFLVKPPGFQADRKYPVLFLIHGGPQGAWGESWTYRWNAQVFAGAGYLVVMPNPRGSTGYGQRFTDEINGDWGGKVLDDLMAVADNVAARPYADQDRMAAAGGSYGGYMIDWMLGHTTRFKAFVSHAGVFDLRSMAGETEELWFPIWEFKGMPWDNPEMYAKWSPSYYVKDFKTPTLVMHGELDYRVPVGQGMQLFTALQLQKVPSKLVLFPDEGHWINKPRNSQLWYNQFLEWVGEWTKKP